MLRFLAMLEMQVRFLIEFSRYARNASSFFLIEFSRYARNASSFFN